MIIDLHQDISVELLENGVKSFMDPTNNQKLNTGEYSRFGITSQINYPRLIAGDCRIVVGASCALRINKSGIIVPPAPLNELLRHVNLYLELARNYPRKIKIIKKNRDLDIRSTSKQEIRIILSVEGLYCVKNEKDLVLVDQLYNTGIRIIGPLWNIKNALGGGIDSPLGLTHLGELLIRYLNQKGIIIDGSHANDRLLDEILKYSSKPIIISHSLSRGVHNIQRNLSDKHTKDLCNKGGLIGICFVASFVGSNNIDELLHHIIHIKSVASINNICIGSDYGAMSKEHLIRSLESPNKIENLVDLLKKAGMKEKDIDKILWKNAYNFLSDNIKG